MPIHYFDFYTFQENVKNEICVDDFVSVLKELGATVVDGGVYNITNFGRVENRIWVKNLIDKNVTYEEELVFHKSLQEKMEEKGCVLYKDYNYYSHTIYNNAHKDPFKRFIEV